MKSWKFVYIAMIKFSLLNVPSHKNIEINQSGLGSYFSISFCIKSVCRFLSFHALDVSKTCLFSGCCGEVTRSIALLLKHLNWISLNLRLVYLRENSLFAIPGADKQDFIFTQNPLFLISLLCDERSTKGMLRSSLIRGVDSPG